MFYTKNDTSHPLSLVLIGFNFEYLYDWLWILFVAKVTFKNNIEVANALFVFPKSTLERYFNGLKLRKNSAKVKNTSLLCAQASHFCSCNTFHIQFTYHNKGKLKLLDKESEHCVKEDFHFNISLTTC